jgi:hypothetical protein
LRLLRWHTDDKQSAAQRWPDFVAIASSCEKKQIQFFNFLEDMPGCLVFEKLNWFLFAVASTYAKTNDVYPFVHYSSAPARRDVERPTPSHPEPSARCSFQPLHACCAGVESTRQALCEGPFTLHQSLVYSFLACCTRLWRGRRFYSICFLVADALRREHEAAPRTPRTFLTLCERSNCQTFCGGTVTVWCCRCISPWSSVFLPAAPASGVDVGFIRFAF